MNNKKIFLIINSYYLGDILLVNPLVQNIKRLYKDSYIVMLTDEKFYDAAKYQYGIDDVIIWDRKNKHKSFINTIKFAINFPYKNIYATFPIYGLDRPVFLSWLLRSKYIIAPKNGKFAKYLIRNKYNDFSNTGQVQIRNINLLKGLTKQEVKNCKMIYNPTSFDFGFEDYICLCPVSSKLEKDMPYNTIVEIIKNIDKKVILLGSGKVCKDLSQKLKLENLDNLVDYFNKTTINQAGFIMKNSKGVISVDTGLLHLSLAVNASTVALFYTDNTTLFIPDTELYNNVQIVEEKTADNIVKVLNNF